MVSQNPIRSNPDRYANFGHSPAVLPDLIVLAPLGCREIITKAVHDKGAAFGMIWKNEKPVFHTRLRAQRQRTLS